MFVLLLHNNHRENNRVLRKLYIPNECIRMNNKMRRQRDKPLPALQNYQQLQTLLLQMDE